MLAPCARGDVGEHRERQHAPYGRRRADGDHGRGNGGWSTAAVASRGRGEEGGRARRAGAHQEIVGVARSGRGRPRRPEFVEDERGEPVIILSIAQL